MTGFISPDKSQALTGGVIVSVMPTGGVKRGSDRLEITIKVKLSDCSVVSVRLWYGSNIQNYNSLSLLYLSAIEFTYLPASAGEKLY